MVGWEVFGDNTATEHQDGSDDHGPPAALGHDGHVPAAFVPVPVDDAILDGPNLGRLGIETDLFGVGHGETHVPDGADVLAGGAGYGAMELAWCHRLVPWGLERKNVEESDRPSLKRS